MPRIYTRRIDWDNPDERRIYNRELQQRKRAEQPKMPRKRRRVLVKPKRDIFEVAAQLEKALINCNCSKPSDDAMREAGAALAAYRQFWEED